MPKYSEEAKQKALEVLEKQGSERASKITGINAHTLLRWRHTAIIAELSEHETEEAQQSAESDGVLSEPVCVIMSEPEEENHSEHCDLGCPTTAIETRIEARNDELHDSFMPNDSEMVIKMLNEQICDLRARNERLRAALISLLK